MRKVSELLEAVDCSRCGGTGLMPLSSRLRSTLIHFDRCTWHPMKTILKWFPTIKRTTVNQRVSKLMKLGLVERRTGNNSEPVYRRVK